MTQGATLMKQAEYSDSAIALAAQWLLHANDVAVAAFAVAHSEDREATEPIVARWGPWSASSRRPRNDKASGSQPLASSEPGVFVCMVNIPESRSVPPPRNPGTSLETSAIKAALVSMMVHLPTLRTQRAAAAIVRRVWEGFSAS